MQERLPSHRLVGARALADLPQPRQGKGHAASRQAKHGRTPVGPLQRAEPERHAPGAPRYPPLQQRRATALPVPGDAAHPQRRPVQGRVPQGAAHQNLDLGGADHPSSTSRLCRGLPEQAPARGRERVQGMDEGPEELGRGAPGRKARLRGCQDGQARHHRLLRPRGLQRRRRMHQLGHERRAARKGPNPSRKRQNRTGHRHHFAIWLTLADQSRGARTLAPGTPPSAARPAEPRAQAAHRPPFLDSIRWPRPRQGGRPPNYVFCAQTNDVKMFLLLRC